jgi:Flp pilus assembly protein TadG
MLNLRPSSLASLGDKTTVAIRSLLRRAPAADSTDNHGRERGQIMIILVMAIFVLTGMVAMVIDISWYWSNSLRVQRAADAAALAGAVKLPNDYNVTSASARALAFEEATKNGYTDGLNGVTINPTQDTTNNRRLNVSITAPVDTFFMRIFGISSIPATRSAKAEFTLPVPMGSPQNYYGVGRFTGAVPTTTTTDVADQTDWRVHGALVSGGLWTGPANVLTNNNVYASETTNNEAQQWTSYGLQGSGQIPNDPTLVIDGLEVALTDIRLTGSGTATNCRVRVETSWNNGASWSSQVDTPVLTTSDTDPIIGSATSTAAWGAHAWVYNDFSDTNFRVRLTWRDGISGCASTQSVRLDMLEVRVSFHTTTTSTSWSIQSLPVIAPDGTTLAPQNFWGAMQSQGAPSVQGDAYMTKYQTRTSTLSSTYCPYYQACTDDPAGYYNYGVEIPAGPGEVWIFDPGFCDATRTIGTGESWTIGGSNGADPTQPVSAFYRLYSTNNTPYDYADDAQVSSTTLDNEFRRGFRNNGAEYYDAEVFSAIGNTVPGDLDGSSTYTDCSSQSWHHGWWQLASGLPAGTYRLHTTSTDQASPTDQDNTTALNAFAFWVTGSGATSPRVYGLGAMEAYFPLPADQASTFYLAQIEAAHAGKWMDIDLWDPGDTGNLVADLEILMPTTSGFAPVNFYYNSATGTTLPPNYTCGPTTSSSVASLRTNTGGTSLFNGKWVRICVQLPDDYSAEPDPVTGQDGWWKIRYTMGAGTNPSTDLTTWKVNIRGNPVHLVVP